VFKRTHTEVIKDRPQIKLIEAENFRFDPAADWTNPIESSPYLIEIMPTYLNDLMRYIEGPAQKGGKNNWRTPDREAIRAANDKHLENALQRDGKQNPKDTDHRVKEFEIIYMHRNIVRQDGEDYEYYTVGTQMLLSDPVPLDSPIGRPYQCGVSTIEAHRVIPAGSVQLGEQLQAEANDIANQRLDNVKLALNKGFRVQRNKGTDLAAMRRSYPGRVILTDDINSIVPDEIRDVTSSSFAEQDRINSDMDDIVGGFSQASVASNRALNQTVGGMEMISNSSNALTGYIVRTFVETWVEPVLNDIIRLIQEYESDENIQKFVGDRQVEMNPENMLKGMSASVSVGFGNLDPKMKVQSMTQALGVLAQVTPATIAKLDDKAIAREVFGVIGYRDGGKFFKTDEDMKKEAEAQGQPQDPMAEVKAMEVQLKQQQMQDDQQYKQAMLQIQMEEHQANLQLKQAEMELKERLGMAQIASQQGVTLEKLYATLDLDERKHNLDITRTMTQAEQIKRDREEMMLKERHGSGI
jgi:DNA-binding phage protein